MKLVPVATFNEGEPAQKLRACLEQSGVPAFIHDESKIERFWFMTLPLAAVHVEVPQEKFSDAMRVIAEWDAKDAVLRESVRCPDCHSSRIEFPQLPRKFALPTLFRLLMAARLIREEFYCIDCHYTWPTRVPIEPERDVLGFPVESKWDRFKKNHRRCKPMLVILNDPGP